MMRLLLFFILVISIQSRSLAQEELYPVIEEQEQVIETTTVSPPTDRVELRSFDQARIDQLRSEYDHDRDIRRVPTLWERFKEWLSRWLERFFGSSAGKAITDNLVYIVIFLSLVFAIVMLSRGGFSRVFHSAPRSLGEVSTSEDDIREMDLGELIAEAERACDLRRAIRLHYLLVLRQLVDREILSWHPHFTDQDYMAQIKDPVLRSRFAHVALIFQWVWYGNAEVAPAKYEDLRRPFIEFETSKAA